MTAIDILKNEHRVIEQALRCLDDGLAVTDTFLKLSNDVVRCGF